MCLANNTLVIKLHADTPKYNVLIFNDFSNTCISPKKFLIFPISMALVLVPASKRGVKSLPGVTHSQALWGTSYWAIVVISTYRYVLALYVLSCYTTNTTFATQELTFPIVKLECNKKLPVSHITHLTTGSKTNIWHLLRGKDRLGHKLTLD